YGHIRYADLNPLSVNNCGAGNGVPHSVSTNPNTIGHFTMQPLAMGSGYIYWQYKPNQYTSYWGNYINPGADRWVTGDYTYIVWSCVQKDNNGTTQSAGGLVRALGKRSRIVDRCDVWPIYGKSYWPGTATVDGYVASIYVKTTAGPGSGGDAIYGWLVCYYQTLNGTVYPCIANP
ncbi:MAG: hypothetical protein ABJC04_08435, partial [Verrucomicrobiota bacterium]